MFRNLKSNLKETLLSMGPIILLVFVLTFFYPIPKDMLISFIVSAFLLIIGISLFNFGADLSILNIGKKVGNKLVKSKKLWIILFFSFLLGTLLTIAEPDLRVLADQLLSIPSNLLIIVVSVGVGIYMLISSLRSIYGLNLNLIYAISYILIFSLVVFVDKNFVPFAFDSGGATTGTVSIPFIITLGIGLVSNRMDKKAKESNFGLVGLCSIGPIIVLFIMGILFKVDASFDANELVNTTFNLNLYITEFIQGLKSTLFAIAPVVTIFLVYQIFFRGFNKYEFRKTVLGLIIVFIGLVIFLTSVNVGFIDVGYYMGSSIVNGPNKYLLIPITMVFAYFIAIAEPAVSSLVNQVVKVTGGTISKKLLNFALASGVAISAGLGIVRVFTGLPFIYFIFPCYLIAIVLMPFIPSYITAIAFDAGGATGGTLTTAFIIPLSIGACLATGGNILTDAFGISALISVIPNITIELIGLVYNVKTKNIIDVSQYDDTIVSYNWRRL